MGDVFVCDAVRTPIGRFGGSLAKVRADDLAAAPIKALMARHPRLDWSALDEVYFGCANQAGEDNRNVARMALLLAGLPETVPGLTLNRLCASGLDAVGAAGRAIRAGEIEFAIAGGVEFDDAGAVRDGQGAGGVFALGGNLRHHHRLALHQSLDEGAIWRRRDARDRRERRRGIPGLARRSGRVRDPLAAARGPGHRLRLFRRGDHRGLGTGRQGRADLRGQGRASSPRDHARRPDKTEADRAQSRHGDGRQCVGRQ